MNLAIKQVLYEPIEKFHPSSVSGLYLSGVEVVVEVLDDGGPVVLDAADDVDPSDADDARLAVLFKVEKL